MEMEKKQNSRRKLGGILQEEVDVSIKQSQFLKLFVKAPDVGKKIFGKEDSDTIFWEQWVWTG